MSSRPSSPSPTRGRRGARRLAVQALYRWQIAGGEAAFIVSEFLEEANAAQIDRDYFRRLVSTAIEDAGKLDALLEPCLDRPAAELDAVEHAVLLAGAAELRDHPELAVSIVTNEAVELAKTFGAEGGHRYVNGVLDKLAAGLRPNEIKSSGG
ncbi:MAG: transcription antitermination factor NusB [Gammaproteobacteria bacterium]|nr:transcription antitermination factor NusB [Gammaproteobacteria bacterium]